MIPQFDKNGNLPSGIHEANWEEIVERFGYNKKRRELLDGLRKALDDLTSVGCQIVYINGSFITEKPMPNDFDACWENNGVNRTLINQNFKFLIDSTNVQKNRKIQKGKYGGELYPSHLWTDVTDPEGDLITYLEMFQTDKETDEPKGIIMIRLNSNTNDKEFQT